MRFLYISNSKHLLYPTRDASTRYRCFNPVEALNEMGHIADLCTQHELSQRHLDAYDVYIFHRPRYTRRLQKYVNRLNRSSQITIADYDDLLFTPELASFSPIVRNGQASIRIARKLHENYLAALGLFDHFTTSTEPLAEQIRDKIPTAAISVIHNGYSPTWLYQSEQAVPDADVVTAGYFPGTRSHDHDFALIKHPLENWLRSESNRLMVVGPLRMENSGMAQTSVTRRPHVPYHALPRLISQCNVTLAPLESTPFNQCKSGIKFIESALSGVPLIASPIPDIARFVQAGALLAHTPSEFGEMLDLIALEKAPDDTRRRSLYRYAVTHCSAKTETERLLDFIRSIRERTRPSEVDVTPAAYTGYKNEYHTDLTHGALESQ